jgi:hypothetical protein
MAPSKSIEGWIENKHLGWYGDHLFYSKPHWGVCCLNESEYHLAFRIFQEVADLAKEYRGPGETITMAAVFYLSNAFKALGDYKRSAEVLMPEQLEDLKMRAH